MAEDHGLIEDEGAYAAFDPVVYVAATDAGVVYGNKDIFS
jgi:hypothetical protein